MTPKERVLKKYPNAYLWRWQSIKFFGVEIDGPFQQTLGQGKTPQAAWAEAARNIRPVSTRAASKEKA